MQRTLLARSVTFGGDLSPSSRRRRNRFSPDGRSHQRRLDDATKKKHPRRGAFGSFDDVANCVFKPKVGRGDPMGEMKEEAKDETENNFVQRQEAWVRKVRREKDFRIGKKDYDLRQDKKVCPSCGAIQAYDEFEQKRNRCVDCAVDYVAPNRGNIAKFLDRLQGQIQKSHDNKKDLLKHLRSQETKAYKLKVKHGKVLKVPLFPKKRTYGLDAFFDRLETDILRRQDIKSRTYDDDDVRRWASTDGGPRFSTSVTTSGPRSPDYSAYLDYYATTPPTTKTDRRRPASSAGGRRRSVTTWNNDGDCCKEEESKETSGYYYY